MGARVRLALLAVAALTALSSVLTLGGTIGHNQASASSALLGASDHPDLIVATPARPRILAVLRAPPLVPLGVAVGVAAAVISWRRRRRLQGLHGRLGDVGDAWRALLIGAPPNLL